MHYAFEYILVTIFDLRRRIRKCHNVWSVREVFPDDPDVEELNRTAATAAAAMMNSPAASRGGDFYLFPPPPTSTAFNTPSLSSGVPSATATPLPSASHSFSSILPGGGGAGSCPGSPSNPPANRKSSLPTAGSPGIDTNRSLSTPFRIYSDLPGIDAPACACHLALN